MSDKNKRKIRGKTRNVPQDAFTDVYTTELRNTI